MLRLLAALACSLGWGTAVLAQFETRLYEFPEYGFKIPFFADAKRTVHDAGTPSERIDYTFAYTSQGKLYAWLRIYPQIGCLSADTLYSQSERYVRHYENNIAFRILTSSGNTYPFGWTGYFATAVVDAASGSGHIASREYQGFINGKVMFMVDIVTQEHSFADEIYPILEDPGYNSILLPQDLGELGLRISTRGNVTRRYEPSEKKYYIGRCDKLGMVYPFATFARLDSDPASAALAYLGEARQMADADDVRIETLPAEGNFSRLSGQVHRLSYHLRDDSAEGQVLLYLFTFDSNHYVASLVVPFVQDDNKVYWYQDNEITAETVQRFDERLREMLGTIERLR
ncbi:MAG: hypothetical protein OHK0039_06010 [Bacteroidia bacterium]